MLLAQAYLTRQQLSAVARDEPVPPQIIPNTLDWPVS
jgi:hypothetical protein